MGVKTIEKGHVVVFVYGTLRRNEVNHPLLKGSPCIAQQAWTFGRLFDTGLGYPAMQQSDEGRVYGELYEIDALQLFLLDELEDYQDDGRNNLYERITQSIYTDKGKQPAYVYVMNQQKKYQLKNQIISGDWKEYRLYKSNPLYYFAYGSCMDNARLKKANVNHLFQKITGRGILKGYSLRFTIRFDDGGRADIVEEDGVVEGKLYEVTREAVDYLYEREGVHLGWYRPALIQVEMDDRSIKEALTFIVVDKGMEVAPPSHYMEEIIRGGEGFLSRSYLELLKKIPLN